MRFRKSAHAVYKTEYHIVWTPRYRKKLFVEGVQQYAEEVLRHVEGLSEDIEVIRVSVQLDHIHMVIVVPPRVSVARVVQYIKSRSARELKAKFPFMNKAIWGREGIWSRGYCVSTVGLSEKEILSYVEHQEKEDKGQLKLDLG